MLVPVLARPFHGLPNSGEYLLRPDFNFCVHLCYVKYLNVIGKLLFCNFHVAQCYNSMAHKLYLPAKCSITCSVSRRASVQLLLYNTLADLGGMPGTRPPYGTQFFCFRIHFYQKVPASEVHAPPPTGNPGSATVIPLGQHVFKSLTSIYLSPV